MGRTSLATVLLSVVLLCVAPCYALAPKQSSPDSAGGTEATVDTDIDSEDHRRRLLRGSTYLVPILPAREYLDLKLSTDGLHYLMPLFVGTPKQLQFLIIDTGSMSLVFLSNDYCTSEDAVRRSEAVGDPAKLKLLSDRSCFLESNSTTFQTQGSSHSFGLSIDGETVSDRFSEYANDIVTLATRVDGSQAIEIRQKKLNIAVSGNLDTTGNYLHQFPDNDGVLGIGYPPSLQAFDFSSDIGSGPPSIGLDFRGRYERSRMTIGGIDDFYRNHLIFGAPYLSPQEYHRVQMSSLTVCGVELLRGIANDINGRAEWPALIDTGSSCFTLPAELFDMLMSWIPVDCEFISLDDDQPGQNNGVLPETNCNMPFLKDNVDVDKLPTLSFQIYQGSPLLYIRLKDLIMERDGKQQLCLVRGERMLDTEEMRQPLIIFGSMSLRSLYTVLHYDLHMVGLANKDQNKKPPSLNALPVTSVRGCK